MVRVQASPINGFDLSVAQGRLVGMMEHRYPVMLGKDLAGSVEALGAGVDSLTVGDRVFGVVMKPYLGDGSPGELVATPSAFLAKVPDAVDLTVAGALGLAGTAASDAVDAIEAGAGHTVLVAGATGGVGAIAVQLLRALGATVIATAATEDGRALVTRLGAHHSVDHRGDLAAAVRSVQPDGVDAALHLAGDSTTIAELVRPGGRVASTLGFNAEQADRHHRHGDHGQPLRRHPWQARRRRRRRNRAYTRPGRLPPRPGPPGVPRLRRRHHRQTHCHHHIDLTRQRTTTTPVGADIESILPDGQGTWTLDSTGTSAEFYVQRFWGAVTVHGRFERLDGRGTIAPDGAISITVDRTAFGMTWSPLRMAAEDARGVITARSTHA